MDRAVCTEPQCLYSTAIPLLPLWTVRSVQNLSACTVQLYLYSPQCLYSRAIPLLPLWTVRSVQNLSACTRLHSTFTICLTRDLACNTELLGTRNISFTIWNRCNRLNVQNTLNHDSKTNCFGLQVKSPDDRSNLLL